MQYEPRRRGRPPKYLDRALTQAETRKLYRLKRKGVVIPERACLHPALREAYTTYTIAARAGTDEALRQALANLLVEVQATLGEH